MSAPFPLCRCRVFETDCSTPSQTSAAKATLSSAFLFATARRAWACTRGQSRLATDISSLSGWSGCALVSEEFLERTQSGFNSGLGIQGPHISYWVSPARFEDCHRMGRSVNIFHRFEKIQSRITDICQDRARLLTSLSAKARHL